MDEKYILVSLEEEKSKQLANVLSNNTSRKVLDFLANRNMSETELSDELKMPISTVHYNVQNLLKNNLVEVKDFLYSEKGNKINIYGITNKMIVIVPKGIEIKNMLLTIGFSVVAAGIAYAFTMKYAAETLGIIAAKSAESFAAPMVANEAVQISQNAVSLAIPTNIIWFLGGAVAAALLYTVISYIRKK